jgi:hypothetical protein
MSGSHFARDIGERIPIQEIHAYTPTILRRTIAFAVAPAGGMVVAALCFQLISAAMGIELMDRSPPESLIEAISYLLGTFFVIAFGALPAYLATIVVGVPLHVWFETKNWRALYAYLALGVGLSMLALLILQSQTSILDMANRVIPSTLIGGLVGGVIFLRICFRRRFLHRPISMTATTTEVNDLKGVLPKSKRKLGLREIDHAVKEAVTARRKE